MVMDATQPQQPSPQSVGREFVRQYYTLLNKAPNHLHRFYNNNSSFIHGESTLVVGQKNIHNRIQQLNFHDCHAKISQVDAQATLGNGVVVQVTGELSNDGQPMRRFTQTFVLAAQSPKKYYVHNDIFRYQDLYSDEEVDGESRSENDDDHEQQLVPQPLQGGQVVIATPAAPVVQANDQPAPVVSAVNEPQGLPSQVVAGSTASSGVLNQQAQAVYYPMPAAGGRPMAVLPPPPGAAPVPLAANFANAAVAAGVPSQSVPVAGVTQLNGVVAHEELITNIQQTTVAQQPQLAAANQTPSPVLTQAAGTVSVGNATVLGAQAPAGVGSVPVAVSASAATGLPQNPASAIPNYQQSPLMPTHILQQPQQQPQQPLPNTPSQMQQPQTLLQQTPLTAGTNIVDVDDTISSNTINISSTAPPSVSEQQQQQQQQSRPNTAANVVASGQTVASAATSVLEPTPAPVVEDFKTINEQQQQEKYEAAKQQQQQQNELKTYANLFKSPPPNSFVKAAMQQQQQLQQQQQQQQQQTVSSIYQQTNSSNITSSNTYSQSASSTTSMPVYGNRNNDNTSMRQDNNNSQGSGAPLPQRSNAKGFNKDFEPRRTTNSQQFGDSQQLFLGNIPHHASEDELKALFSRFGQVVDLRILSKSSGKLPPGARNPLNYGFITYNDAEAVQNCLANCPLYFPDSADGQKLNVEEKKPRTRPNDMPPRQNMGGGGSGGSGMNSMNNNQRNMSGGPPSRSLSNSGSGSMMRGNSVGNNTNSMSRGGSSGGGSGGPPRMGGAFNRNDNRASNGGGSGGGSQMRGGNNNSQSQGNSYGVRR
ncbi:ras GTPase-activating protein-binding protein 2 [Calliphora vicina]|uniref:ras GTPase-activating protein-binding protein 2 n=1 Tax=Calliphora vicina TaxID=7373 RepID=UPI00325A67FE